jgi:hypothetical protein
VGLSRPGVSAAIIAGTPYPFLVRRMPEPLVDPHDHLA